MISSRTGQRRVLQISTVVVASALALSGCGRGSSSSSSSSSAGSDSSTITVAATFPQSGPLAVTGATGRGVKAAIDEANAAGGVNGKQVKWVDYDDAYEPARMVANARKAVQQDKADVLVSFGGPSLAIRPYANQNKVFHVVLAGNTAFSDKKFPYTHAAFPDLEDESEVLAAAVKKKQPNAVVGVLGFNNDLTDSQVAGLTAGGLKPKVVLKVPPSQQDVTSQITQAKQAGVDTLFMSVSGGQIIGAVKYMAAIKYKPTVALYSATAGKTDAIGALGPDAEGLMTAMWVADPADPLWAKESDVAKFKKAIAGSGEKSDADSLLAMLGYLTGQGLVAALESAKSTDGDAINAAWEGIDGVQVAGLPPGTTLKYGADSRLQHTYQVVRLEGGAWKPEGAAVDTEAP